jgi:hypothetical protein
MHFPIDWQDAVAWVVTGGATFYLARRLIGTFRRAHGGCASGCSACPKSVANRPALAADQHGSTDLVQIGMGPASAPQTGPHPRQAG